MISPRMRRVRRAGLATLEVVMTAGICMPAASAFYFLYEKVLNHYCFMVTNSVGMPLL